MSARVTVADLEQAATSLRAQQPAVAAWIDAEITRRRREGELTALARGYQRRTGRRPSRAQVLRAIAGAQQERMFA